MAEDPICARCRLKKTAERTVRTSKAELAMFKRLWCHPFGPRPKQLKFADQPNRRALIWRKKAAARLCYPLEAHSIAISKQQPKSNVNLSKRVWEKLVQLGETSCAGRTRMTSIPAEVVAAHKLVNQYHVIVRIEASKYRGSFATLVFGDNKPLIGACHERRVDLIYVQDPGLQVGQQFPLWTIQ